MLLMPTHGADTLQAVQASERDLSSMRVLAAPGLTPERRVAMRDAFGVAPLADYGLSEVPGHAAHGLREAEAKMVKTEGRPYDGTEIRILGPGGAPLPAGEVGDVVVNGPSRFLGFLGNDELTRESLTEWGGYRTGDLGYLDEDGHLVYVGRSKDIIRRGGVTVVPAEIEPVLMRHPADPRGGDRAASRRAARRAGVRRRSSSSPAGRRRRSPTCRSSSSRRAWRSTRWPESVEIFDDFPRTASLKVVKRDVVREIEGRAARAPSRSDLNSPQVIR